MFIQLHVLTSFSGVLLNRDDVGQGKTISIGGVTRQRISSQCLKRHWKTFNGKNSLKGLEVAHSVTSREIFQQKIFDTLVAEHPELDKAKLAAITAEVRDLILKAKEKKEDKEDKKGGKGKSAEGPTLSTSQPIVFGVPEINALKNIVLARCQNDQAGKFTKDEEANLRGLALAAGLEASIFGRMVTSDILARTDSAISVAHAVTVHAASTESDYFSVVDDLIPEEGSAHINTTELTDGLYYIYVVIDVPQLVSNTTGCPAENWRGNDRQLAAQVVDAVTRMVCTVSPGAKKGSTAPYAYAHSLMAEVGMAQPRTLMTAFEQAIKNDSNRRAASYAAMARYLKGLDEGYGRGEERRLFDPQQEAGVLASVIDGTANLQGITDWLISKIKEG